MASEGVGTVDLDTIVNLDDLERAAERVMDKQDFDYFAGGSPSFPETPERLRDGTRAERGLCLGSRRLAIVPASP